MTGFDSGNLMVTFTGAPWKWNGAPFYTDGPYRLSAVEPNPAPFEARTIPEGRFARAQGRKNGGHQLGERMQMRSKVLNRLSA